MISEFDSMETTKFEIVDITEQLMAGEVKCDPGFLKETDITQLIRQQQLREEEHAKKKKNKSSLVCDPDEDEDEDQPELEDGDLEYLPSICNLTDAKEIAQYTRFREDEEPEELKSAEREMRISQVELKEVADNPVVQKLLRQMPPDQITPELVSKLLGSAGVYK